MGYGPGAIASPKQFYQGQPGTSVAVVYTSPATSGNVPAGYATATMTEIVACNTTGAAATVSVCIGGAGAANAVLWTVSIPANDTKTLELATQIPASTSIEAGQGTASAITLTISGTENQ